MKFVPLFAISTLFAEGSIDWMDKFGSSGIAAVAIVWLTHRHENVIKNILASQEVSLGKLATAIDKLDIDQEQRNREYKSLCEKQIESLSILANKTQTLVDQNKDTERRLEIIEKTLPIAKIIIPGGEK